MKVSIIGAGLIGGSIGLALKAADRSAAVTAFDQDRDAARRAVERGAADAVAGSIADAAREADVIFVCVPVGASVGVLVEAADAAPSGCILTDVGSTKARVVVEVEETLKEGAAFVGGHPMAGSEDEGIAAARADLFGGAWWILTPTERTPQGAVDRLTDLLTTLGARIALASPEEHDEVMAIVSHLPQMVASALMVTASEEAKDQGMLALGAGGFRDVTRIAASNPAMWADIVRDNRAAVLRALDAFGERLGRVRDQVEREDADSLVSFLERGRMARRGLPTKPVRQDLAELHVPVPDRHGVLAEVTATAGELGVNIEDLAISHASGAARGVLHLSLASAEDLARLANALEVRGYTPVAGGTDV